MDSNDPQSRLERGETLIIDDQMRTYITLEDNEVVSRSVLARLVDRNKTIKASLKSDEKRHPTLVDALLSLMDYEWEK
jgi:hypothetical protein